MCVTSPLSTAFQLRTALPPGVRRDLCDCATFPHPRIPSLLHPLRASICFYISLGARVRAPFSRFFGTRFFGTRILETRFLGTRFLETRFFRTRFFTIHTNPQIPLLICKYHHINFAVRESSCALKTWVSFTKET